MTYHKLFCGFIGLMLSALTVSAATLPHLDTTAKNKILPIGGSSNQLQGADFLAYFKDGIELLKQDDLTKGINLLNTGFQQIDAQASVLRTMPYTAYELVSILKEVNGNTLSAKEKKLGQVFIKNMFVAGPAEADKIILPLIKQAPNTLFTKRVRLFMLTAVNSKKAPAEVDALLKLNPNLVPANILKAEQCFDNEQYAKCISYSTRLINILPKYAHAYHMRAKANAGLTNYEKAITDYDAAIKLSPQMQVVIYDKADALMELERYAEAITAYKLFVPSEYKWTFYNIARAYRNLDKPDSAIYYINEHIRQYPDDEDGYNIKGDIFTDKQDFEKAVSAYTTGLQFAPKDDDLYEDRGDAYFWNHQYTEAINDYQKAIEIESTPFRLNRMGSCYYYLNEYDKAILFHNKAIKLNPKYKYSYWSLNLTYNKMQRYNDAIAAAHKAIAIDSTYDSALGNLGWSYYCAGDYKNCIKYSYKALQYKPSAAYAMFNIALATLHNGDFEKAKERYRFFIDECHKKDYKINDGAIDDLRDLIKQNFMAKEATYIIEEIFKAKP